MESVFSEVADLGIVSFTKNRTPSRNLDKSCVNCYFLELLPTIAFVLLCFDLSIFDFVGIVKSLGCCSYKLSSLILAVIKYSDFIYYDTWYAVSFSYLHKLPLIDWVKCLTSVYTRYSLKVLVSHFLQHSFQGQNIWQIGYDRAETTLFISLNRLYS